jgi:hypothetical protein
VGVGDDKAQVRVPPVVRSIISAEKSTPTPFAGSTAASRSPGPSPELQHPRSGRNQLAIDRGQAALVMPPPPCP